MHVYFSAFVVFTQNISVKFWRKLQKDCIPFTSLTGSGGPKGAQFQGVLDLGSDGSDEMLQYQITEALVNKVELLSKVGVDRIEFDEVTRGIDGPLQKVHWTEQELQRLRKRKLEEILCTRFGYPHTKRMTKAFLIESVLCAQRDIEVQSKINEILKK